MTAALLVLSVALAAQEGLAPGGVGTPPLVAEVLERIDPERLRAHVDRLAGFGTRHTFSDTTSGERGIGAARRWLTHTLQGFGGRWEVEYEGFVHDSPRGPIEVVNVVATLPGSRDWSREQRVLVTAHYDSRASDRWDAETDAPGANDNASGVALLLELARVLAEQELERSVVLVATAGEEQGLWGATHHAERMAGERQRVVAVLNADIVGDPSGPMRSGEADSGRDEAGELVRVFSPDEPGAQSREVARLVARVAASHRTEVRPLLVFRADRLLRGGDHLPFARLGIPAVRFTELWEDYTRQHQDPRTEDGVRYGDLAEHVDADYLAGVTRLAAAALLHLANAPSAPEPELVLERLTNETSLRWLASPEPDVAGYEVVWRLTTEPVWTHARDVGEALEATLEVSKDDHVFGVRAYDQAGYRSPAAEAGIR